MRSPGQPRHRPPSEIILDEWVRRVARPLLRGPGEVQRDGKITELKHKLHEANEKAGELQNKLDALAAVAANVYQENLQLKEKKSRGQQGRPAWTA